MIFVFGISVLSLVGYGVFNHLYPKPQSKKDVDFKSNPVFSGANFISPNPKVWDHSTKKKKFRAYKFKCNINPNIAMIKSQSVEMLIPDEYSIKEFTLLVDPSNNEVHYVHLGTSQYHCDLDTVSHCLCIQDLYLEPLDQEFLKKLMGVMLTYDILDAYSQDHWENEKFVSMNTKLTSLLEAAA
jgi:hypothetical protein